MAGGSGLGQGAQPRVGLDADARDDDPAREAGERLQHDVLILESRNDRDDRPSVRVAERRPGGREIAGRHGGVDALERNPVRHDAEPCSGVQPPPQRARHGLAHRDRPVRREADR